MHTVLHCPFAVRSPPSRHGSAAGGVKSRWDQAASAAGGGSDSEDEDDAAGYGGAGYALSDYEPSYTAAMGLQKVRPQEKADCLLVLKHCLFFSKSPPFLAVQGESLRLILVNDPDWWYVQVIPHVHTRPAAAPPLPSCSAITVSPVTGAEDPGRQARLRAPVLRSPRWDGPASRR